MDIAQACKWIFGSLAIAYAIHITEEPMCLWAFLLLVAG